MSDDGDDLSTENTLRERTGVNEYLFWVLLGVDRRVIVGALALVVFVAFVGSGVLKPVSLRVTMERSDMVETLFSGLVGAIITSTTLVVSINQLVLSQEIGSLGTQRNRMDVTMDFYQNTDDLLGKTTPSDPAVLLAEVIEVCVGRARALRDAVAGNDSDELRGKVETYVEDLEENADTAMSELEDSDFGTFNVVSPALDFNYARKMYDARRLGEQYEGEIGDDERSALRDVLEAVTMYGPIREYVKVLYLQWALVKLSRAILYASVPALVVAGAIVVFVDPNTFTGTILGLETILWVVSVGFTISVLPFLVFIAYVLRLATLAKQTLTVGSLILS
ncbi:hypothetical protein NDI76_13240 [Halogeometricum sp. S1BR25-6]|uniref:Uncharacterized protein n=1 Tax=Halogeometricum salsisoli TaxID=2950536 RepID=A0ABU2GFX1_9EURY|nr:hypothetical protein [Halogeometricum sp. S1BR25-6]MDS0299707.1 hypothetical protein [Halogeometricum sp. S1BR25-6]